MELYILRDEGYEDLHELRTILHLQTGKWYDKHYDIVRIY